MLTVFVLCVPVVVIGLVLRSGLAKSGWDDLDVVPHSGESKNRQ